MSNRLYVGNLPFHATEDLITQHFATSGEVKTVNLVLDRMSGQSRGFCFVDMADPDAAQKAIDQVEEDHKRWSDEEICRESDDEDAGGQAAP